jgi:predicted small metal-binding protein
MRGQSEEEVMAEAMRHGKEAHGMTDADFTPEVVAQVRSNIKEA